MKTQERQQSICGLKVPCNVYNNGRQGWEDGIVTKRIGSRMYIMKGQIGAHKQNLKQLTYQRKRRNTDESLLWLAQCSNTKRSWT